MSRTGQDPVASEHMTSAMSKLKDSVNKLREHLDSLHRRRSLPPMSDSEADQLLNGLRTSYSISRSGQTQEKGSARLCNPNATNHENLVTANSNSNVENQPKTLAAISTTVSSPLKNTETSHQRERHDTSKSDKNIHRTTIIAAQIQPEKELEKSQSILRNKRRSYIRQDNMKKDGFIPIRSSQSMQDVSVSAKMSSRKPRNKTGSTARARVRRSRAESDSVDTGGTPVGGNDPVLAGCGASAGSANGNNTDSTANTNRSTSNREQSLTAWERRKLYDNKRRSLQEADMRACSMDLFNRGSNSASVSPTSSSHCGYQPSSRSSSIVSNLSTKSKIRRSLPKVPQGERELEQRRKRISTRAILNARKAQETNCTPSVKDIPKSLPPDMDYVDKREEQLIQCELEQVNGGHEVCNFLDEPFMYMDSSMDSHHSQTHSTEVNNNMDAKGFSHSDNDEQIVVHIPKHESSPHHEKHSSHAALRRIINDLRDAANRPVEAPVMLSGRKPLLSFSDTLPHDVLTNVAGSPLNSKSGREKELDTGYNADGMIKLQISPSSRPAPDWSDVDNDCDLHVLHPSLHRVLMSYDLETIVLHSQEPCKDPIDYGIDLFQAAYLDCPARDLSRNSRFGSLSGRRAVIGHKRGAFMPVCPSLNDSIPVLSLVAVDRVREQSNAKDSGLVFEGDYLIEVNGVYVGNSAVDVVRNEMMKQQHTLQLVVARPKRATPNDIEQCSQGWTGDVLKEAEKLRLKYNIVKQDIAKQLDHSAELSVKMQKLQDENLRLEDELRRRNQEVALLEVQCQQKHDSISQFQFQITQRIIEVEHLHFEIQQREEKIAQLRRLLIQQTEVMHLEGLEADYVDTDYIEKVSTV